MPIGSTVVGRPFVSHATGNVHVMNPNRERAVDVRRRALVDQVDGLEQLIAAGHSEPRQTQRLADTRAELVKLEAVPGR